MGYSKNLETRLINPLLRAIRDNADYLTQPENLPQLAKLGYVYKTLWNAGREWVKNNPTFPNWENYTIWFSNNPKYKLEMSYPSHCSELVSNLIYDAWGMHYHDEREKYPLPIDFWKFVFSTENKVYTELDLKIHKINKTLDDWLEILLNPDYRFHKMNKNKWYALNYLFTGGCYQFDGVYIFERASGGGQNIAIYSGWENAKFLPKIENVLKKLKWDSVEILTVSHHAETKWQEKQRLEGKDWWNHPLDNELFPAEEYLPTGYLYENDIICQFTEQTHPSYIRGGIDFCQNIIEHSHLEPLKTVGFAKNFIERFKNNI
jgi:hypothetical protein